MHAALRGPRAPRHIDPAKSFFRLRIERKRAPGRGIVGSFLWHALLLSVTIPLGRLAAPKPQIALPQIEITWYGPTTSVAPVVATKRKKKAKPEPKPHPKPRLRPRRVVTARAYNPKTTVIFHPPHPDATRQVLIEPDEPPQMPKLLAALPNIIRWVTEAPTQPEMAVNPSQILARRRKVSVEAMLRAPKMTYGTPPEGPLNIVPDTDASPNPPLSIAPSAIHPVRAASPRAAAAPELSQTVPATDALALASGSDKALAPPLPPTPAEVRARRPKRGPMSAAAPSLAIEAQQIVALSLAPGNAPPPPGNAYAPISVGPHVARKISAAKPVIPANASAGAPGVSSPSAMTHGPAGLLILHEDNAGPAPPPPPPSPKPRSASVLPRIAPIAPESLRSTFVPRPKSASAGAKHIVNETLAHRVLGPWRIHTLLLNMPNLTSSSGSWVLDFAEPLGARLRQEKKIIAPLPVHAVDPQYPPQLKSEGIQGTVVLLAMIGRDGIVRQVRVVKSLDPVLDHNAEVAFSKWKFEPALLHNRPIDLKVIVSVPFRYSTAPQ